MIFLMLLMNKKKLKKAFKSEINFEEYERDQRKL